MCTKWSKSGFLLVVKRDASECQTLVLRKSGQWVADQVVQSVIKPHVNDNKTQTLMQCTFINFKFSDSYYT